MWVKIKPPGTAGFGRWLHVEGFHFGYPFLTHSHVNPLSSKHSAFRRQNPSSAPPRKSSWLRISSTWNRLAVSCDVSFVVAPDLAVVVKTSGIPFWGFSLNSPPSLEPILVVGLGCSLGARFGFGPMAWPFAAAGFTASPAIGEPLGGGDLRTFPCQ